MDLLKRLEQRALHQQLCIDGTGQYGEWTGGPEAHGPWAVFDIEAQENVAGPFRFRLVAWLALYRILRQRNAKP